MACCSACAQGAPCSGGNCSVSSSSPTWTGGMHANRLMATAFRGRMAAPMPGPSAVSSAPDSTTTMAAMAQTAAPEYETVAALAQQPVAPTEPQGVYYLAAGDADFLESIPTAGWIALGAIVVGAALWARQR